MWLETLQRVFKQESCSTPEATRKKVLFLFIQLQMVLQNTSFFWQPSVPIQGWEPYNSFWTLLRFSSIDSLAAAFKFNSAFVFTVIGIVSFVILSFIISALLIKSSYEIPGFLRFSLRFCIEIVCSIYYIPSVVALMTLVKYSSHDYPYLEEYPGNIPGNLLNYGSLGVAVGAVGLVLLVIITLIYESCSYDMTYTLENNFYCKSQPYVSIYLKIFLLGQCFMMTSLQSANYVNLMKANCFLYLITTLLILYSVPYHCLFTNAVTFWVFADSTVICSAFLLGILNSSSDLIFVIVIALQPCMIYLSYEIIKYRISKHKQLEASLEISYSNFEHSARSELIKGSKSKTILKELNRHARFNQNELYTVLCANYCLETLENSTLAQLKIEKVKTFTLNLPVMFNIYKCKNALNKINLTQSRGLKCVIFSQTLDFVLKTDLEACISLMSMYNKLLEPDQDLYKLKFLVLRSKNLIESAIKSYLNLLEQVSDSKFALELYGLFLTEILNNKEQGSTYFSKEKSMRKKVILDSQDQLAREESCIFIVSGNPGEQGRFLYANFEALDFLKIPKATLSNTYIFEFLPGPLQKMHRQYLVTFADKCLDNKIPCNVFPYLLINQYLVECSSSSECVVYEQNTYFATFLDPIVDLSREVILIDHCGIIISHSAGLCSIFELEIRHIEGRSINDYLPIQITDLPPGIPVKLELTLDHCNSSKEVAIFLESSSASLKYFTVYLTTNVNEIKEWCDHELIQLGNLEQSVLLSPLSTKKVRFSEHQKAEENKNLNLNFNDTMNSSYSNSAEHVLENKALNLSLRSLRVIGILILVSVSHIQKIALISTIIIIAIFLYEMSIELSDLSITQNLGELNYNILTLSIIIRALDLKYLALIPTTLTVDFGYYYLELLDNSYVLLANSTANWHNCQASEITWKNVIPNWRLVNEQPIMYHSNLQDYVAETMRAVRLT